jgi:hypothetical protein
MYCPVCRDEYRPGFTRCASCDVDLVESLDAGAAKPPAALVPEIAVEAATLNFCGFLTLEEAREARELVRANGVRAEILICDPQGSTPRTPVKEEYWLRVAPRDFKAVTRLLGEEPAAVTEDAADSFACSHCGAMVDAQDSACPSCGLAFE